MMQYVLASLLLLSPLAAPAAGEDGRVLVVGKITDDPQRDLEGLRPLLDYVAAELADVGVTGADIVMARDHVQMTSYLRQGKVDWVTETIGMGTVLAKRTGARIVMNRWKYGERDYATTIFVRRDSDVSLLDDLLGHTIAFEHPGSSTGYMLAALELHLAGLPLALMAGPRERPPEHMVGYLFSGDEINTSTWVHKRLVDAGAISNTDWVRSSQVPEAFTNDLRIIHEGERVPRAVELMRADLETKLEARLLAVLAGAHESERGREAMATFQGTTRFERFDAGEWRFLEKLDAELFPLLEQIR